MAKKPADRQVVDLIRRLAACPGRVEIYRTAVFHLMGSGLTKDDLCEAITTAIDAGKEIRETTLHSIPERLGERAYELKPRINDRLYYVKLALEKRDDDWMLILSAHLDH